MKLILVVCCVALASAAGNGTCSAGPGTCAVAVQGPTGMQGPSGMQGIQGPQGAPGVQGTQGPQGAPGCEGKRGPAGESGPKGGPGGKGDMGDEGPMGLKGDDGKPGEDGKQGARGLQGPQGPQGPQGNPGKDFDATTIDSIMKEITALKKALADRTKPVDGVWSSWSKWDQCTKTCGGGTQKATRTCSGTAYGGKQCAGASVKSQGCNKQKCAPKYNTEFKGSKRKVNSAGVAYAGVFYVDGRAVCDDGLWDDGMKANDIKKQADVACRMAGFPKGWKVQSGEIDDQQFTGDTIYVGLNCKGTEQSLDECTYKQPKKQSRGYCAVGVYLECQY